MRPAATHTDPGIWNPEVSSEGFLACVMYRPSDAGLVFSEKLQELSAIQAGGADDLVERSLGQVATMHRDDDPVGVIGMPEDVVAPLDPIELPAAALQCADRLARRDRRQPRRHAATVTRSISTGPGIGSPCATSDSM